MKTIVLDFETYFDTKGGYTLKKMTTEEYIRDERFAAIALGFAFDGKRGWVAAPQIQDFLDNLDLSNTIVVCHHAAFDGLIISHWYDIRPTAFCCTMSMARAWWPQHGASLEAIARRLGLEQKTVPYKEFDGVPADYINSVPTMLEDIGNGAVRDCELTFDIFNRLIKEGFPHSELPIIDMTVQMFTNPRLEGDVDAFKKLIRTEEYARDVLIAELQISKEDLRSSPRFARLLEAQGVDIETKPGKGGMIPCFASTDQFMKDLQDDENPVVAALAGARISIKSNIRQTRAARLAKAAGRGSLPVYLNYFGASRTGRWSGGDGTNWQNFPRTGELGKCIRAPDGYQLIVADAAQIECRILNYVAKQEDVLDAFRSGRDIYCEIASEIYHRPITKDDRLERFFGKKTELSCGYGIGADTLFKRLRGEGVALIEQQACDAVAIYRRRHSHVVRLWHEGTHALFDLCEGVASKWLSGIVKIEDHHIILPNGTRLHYDLEYDPVTQSYWRTDRRGKNKIWGGSLVGEVVQALAAVFLKEVIQNILTYSGCKPVTLRHDEAVYVVRDCDVELGMRQIKAEFCRAPAWMPGIPLNAEMWAGKDYGKVEPWNK